MKVTKILMMAVAVILMSCKAADNTLVIVHTNDTHSNIDPLADSDLGGVLRRGAFIDSIRAAHPNTLVVDAGDIVQGTLYFHLYKGEVEQKVLNELGYDVQILGNHEFDNGMEALRAMLSQAKPTLLATNYDLSESALNGLFQPWIVKEYGGKKVGILAINLDPKGMVAEGNYDGVKFLPWKETTQRTVDMLRKEQGCDYVIAVTHIGYSASKEKPELFGDVQVAEQTHGIDLIIGGHSHTLLDQVTRIGNTTIVQCGRYGQYLGEITMNLNTGDITEKLILMDNRLDAKRSERLMQVLEPYRAGVDSLYNIEVARLEGTEALNGRTIALQNFAADFVSARGRELADGVEGAISNKGGLRKTWSPGVISEGAALDMMPFKNKVVVIDIKGRDLIEALEIMKARQDYAVSGLGEIDPEKTYRIATIDYLANGGDYMTPLTRAAKVAESEEPAYNDLLQYFKKHPVIIPDNIQRLK